MLLTIEFGCAAGQSGSALKIGGSKRPAGREIGYEGRRAEMRYLSPALALLGALTLQISTAQAVPMRFVGNLSGANEVPAVSPAGTGFASVILDPTAQTIQINVSFSGLTSPTVAAHIHCCVA